jgi:tetratricopeptide (TPR) repeat protein
MRRRLLETESIAAFERVQWAEGRLDEFQAVVGGGDFNAAERILNEWDSLLAEAERLDPNWIEPIVERGELVQYRIMLAAARGTPDDGTELQIGLGHAERALRMSPGNTGALELRGLLRYHLWSQHPPADAAAAAQLRDEAEADLRAAIDGNPDRSFVLRMLSQLAARDGRLEAAAHYAEQAYNADPYLENPGQFLLRLFQYNLQLGRDEEAIRWCLLGAERLPEIPLFYHCQLRIMAWVPSQPADTTRAGVLRDQTLAYYHVSMRPQLQPHLDLLVAAVMARAGARQSARSILDMYLDQELTQLGTLLPAAGALALLGDTQQALDLVEDHVRNNPHDRTTMRQSPALRRLRSDARFSAILEPDPGD